MARTKRKRVPSTGGLDAEEANSDAADAPEVASAAAEVDVPESEDDGDSSDSGEMHRVDTAEAAQAFSSVNRLAWRMVNAHVQGHLERQRLREYEKSRLTHDLQRCLDDAEPRMLKEMKDGANRVGFDFEPKYRIYKPTEDEVRAALPEDIKMFKQDSSFQWYYTLAFRWKDTPSALQAVFEVGLQLQEAFLKAYRDEAYKHELEQRDSD